MDITSSVNSEDISASVKQLKKDVKDAKAAEAKKKDKKKDEKIVDAYKKKGNIDSTGPATS